MAENLRNYSALAVPRLLLVQFTSDLDSHTKKSANAHKYVTYNYVVYYVTSIASFLHRSTVCLTRMFHLSTQFYLNTHDKLRIIPKAPRMIIHLNMSIDKHKLLIFVLSW